MNNETIEEKIENANYLGLTVAYIIKKIGHSPNCCIFDKFYIENIYGESLKVSSAFRYVKRNINYVDDDIIKSINSNNCIRTKLKKDCNNK